MKDNFFLKNTTKVFFVCIGGESMSALAEYFLLKNFTVLGSDVKKTAKTERLQSLGATIFYEQNGKNLSGVDLVVYSSAVDENCVEIQVAKSKNIPCIKRSILLGDILGGFNKSIGVSGCHGKTTTTAMIADIFICAELDPTVFLGGSSKSVHNFRNGNGDFCIVEACEFKKSFLDMMPKIAVVTNIDNDHLDCYKNMQNIVDAFKEFVGDKLAVVNADDVYAQEISNYTTLTFGINNSAHYYATKIKKDKNGYSFTACAFGRVYGRIKLKVQGVYNVYNALCAFAVADLSGVPFGKIKKGLEQFCGVERRNQIIGKKFNLTCKVDYAHHPTEIKSILSTINLDKTIVVFQPHTYSRTKYLMNDFVNALKDVRFLVLVSTYSARESFDELGSVELLKENLQKASENQCIYIKSLAELISVVLDETDKYEQIMFLGAGDVYDLAQKFIEI